MNSCNFIGRFASDPTLKTVNGKSVVNFRLAVNRPVKGGNDDPVWLNFEAWDTGADAIAKHFKKGDPIWVHGYIREDRWKDKTSGEDRSKLVVRVDRFGFVPSNGRKDKPAEAAQVAANTGNGEDAENDADGDQEIPF